MRSEKIMLLTAILALALLVGGCVVTSIHPLYFEEDVVYDQTILGTWSEKGESESWLFKKTEGNAYQLFIFDEESSGEFEARLVRLGDYLFLDIFPKEKQSGNVLYNLHTVPMHSFMKVSIEEDVLHLAPLDKEWFDEMIKQKKITIKHEKRDDLCVLTASTKELQEFVLKYADNEDVFEFGDLYRRKDVE